MNRLTGPTPRVRRRASLAFDEREYKLTERREIGRTVIGSP